MTKRELEILLTDVFEEYNLSPDQFDARFEVWWGTFKNFDLEELEKAVRHLPAVAKHSRPPRISEVWETFIFIDVYGGIN